MSVGTGVCICTLVGVDVCLGNGVLVAVYSTATVGVEVGIIVAVSSTGVGVGSVELEHPAVIASDTIKAITKIENETRNIIVPYPSMP